MQLSLIMLVLVICCLAVSASAAATDDARFQQTADEFITGYLAWRPLQATTMGVHDWDGKLTDYSPASVQREIARLKEYHARLASFAANSLGPQSNFDRRVAQTAILYELFWLADARCLSRDPKRYVPDIITYVTQSFAPPDVRLRHVIAIENALPSVFAAARANLDEHLPRPVVETAISDAKGAAEFFEKDLIDAFSAVKDQLLQASFRAATVKAAAELRAYAAFLEREKLPRSDASYAMGRERYQRMLLCGSISLPPEQILELGTRVLKQEQHRFAEAARAIDPARPAIDVFQAIQREHPTPQSLISDTMKNLDAIRQFVLDRDLVTIPSSVRAAVKETPSYLRSLSFAMMYSPGPLERKATEATYYVTPVEENWSAQEKEQWLTNLNYYTTDITSIHEAYPGHYVQGLHWQSPAVSRTEAVFSDYSFIEGWAHYTEQMLIDEGFGQGGDPLKAAKYRLAQSSDALLRLCRLCVSIRMHCQGMTVEQAARFFHDNCYLQEKPARLEAVRGTFDPEYLYYTLGKLQLLKLRDDYRQQEGPAFSLKQFHDAILGHGAPPIRLLREMLLKDRSQWDQILPQGVQGSPVRVQEKSGEVR